jgi:hypothetical protein
MEELLKYISFELIFSAIVVTFVVSALNTVQTKLTTNLLVFIVSLLITLLRVPLTGGDLAYWQGLLFQILLTMSFAILFYNYVGKWFVDSIFVKIKEKFSK